MPRVCPYGMPKDQFLFFELCDQRILGANESAIVAQDMCNEIRDKSDGYCEHEFQVSDDGKYIENWKQISYAKWYTLPSKRAGYQMGWMNEARISRYYTPDVEEVSIPKRKIEEVDLTCDEEPAPKRVDDVAVDAESCSINFDYIQE